MSGVENCLKAVENRYSGIIKAAEDSLLNSKDTMEGLRAVVALYNAKSGYQEAINRCEATCYNWTRSVVVETGRGIGVWKTRVEKRCFCDAPDQETSVGYSIIFHAWQNTYERCEPPVERIVQGADVYSNRAYRPFKSNAYEYEIHGYHSIM